VVVPQEFPSKLKDPSSFSILCIDAQVMIDRALYDLGASVSLMPNSIFQKLGLGEQPIPISLQFTYGSIKCPLGMLENVLVTYVIFMCLMILSSWIRSKRLMCRLQ